MSRIARLLVAFGLLLGFGLGFGFSGGAGPAGPERTGPAVEALTATLAALPVEEIIPDAPEGAALPARSGLTSAGARGAAAARPDRAVPVGPEYRTPFARAPPAGLG
ncbi:hypothetical protein [Pararhodobacter sp. SW119]|uniref:hypothetical protein n=1 Tax=Pararhodobacter sp. SW119 TaxID=2780075 RepID=UPI001AE0619D|nr:hypothetical protein [Pararhodobacter sp. SW119]